MLAPLTSDISRDPGNTLSSGNTQKDAGVFEQYLDRLSSDSLRVMGEDSPVNSFMAEAESSSGKPSISDLFAAASAKEKRNSSSDISESGLGTRLLTSLSDTHQKYKSFLSYVGEMQDTGSVDPLKILMMQALMLNATTSVEFSTRAVIKLATVLDSMLRLQ